MILPSVLHKTLSDIRIFLDHNSIVTSTQKHLGKALMKWREYIWSSINWSLRKNYRLQSLRYVIQDETRKEKYNIWWLRCSLVLHVAKNGQNIQNMHIVHSLRNLKKEDCSKKDLSIYRWFGVLSSSLSFLSFISSFRFIRFFLLFFLSFFLF